MLLLTTVGTSLFDNCREKHREIEGDYPYLKNQPVAAWESNLRRIKKVKEILLSFIKSTGLKEEISAEIKSLLKIQEQTKEEIKVQLLATDTILSRLIAEVLAEALTSKMKVAFAPEKNVIKGLQVGDRKKFEKEGLVNLVSRVWELQEESLAAETEIGINITGGYKAVIPYLTILGQVYGHRLYYIFEETDELILLPQTPIDINWGVFEKYTPVFSDLARGIYDWKSYQKKHGLTEEDFQACLWEEEGMAELNALGKIFWDKYQNFFLVKVLKGSSYARETNSGNKREVNTALTELYQRLTDVIKLNGLKTTNELQQHITSLGEQSDLRHGENPDQDKFIFKSTRKSQVRLVYTTEIGPAGQLDLKLFDHVRGSFDHKSYLGEFKQRMKNFSASEFTAITLRKP